MFRGLDDDKNRMCTYSNSSKPSRHPWCFLTCTEKVSARRGIYVEYSTYPHLVTSLFSSGHIYHEQCHRGSIKSTSRVAHRRSRHPWPDVVLHHHQHPCTHPKSPHTHNRTHPPLPIPPVRPHADISHLRDALVPCRAESGPQLIPPSRFFLAGFVLRRSAGDIEERSRGRSCRKG